MTLIAVTLLLFAMVLSLAELIGSLVGALLILGSLAAIVAITLYYGAVRPQIRDFRMEISALYDVISLLRGGYDWVIKRIELFVKDLKL